jgi:hypothetical protein
VTLVLCFSFLVACSDDSGASGTDKGPQADTLAADGQAGSDGSSTDGPISDGAAPNDTTPTEGGPQPTEGGPTPVDSAPTPVDSATPLDAGGPTQDASGPSSLQVTIDKVSVWANLMPIVPPDPTHVTLALSLTNTGKQPVKNVTLTNAAIVAVKGSKATPIQLVAQPGFSGNVPGGQTVQATFSKVLGTSATPLPAKCGDNVEVGFTVAFSGGQVGPLTSSAVPFTCAL